jgi:hypothetical protein
VRDDEERLIAFAPFGEWVMLFVTEPPLLSQMM